MKRFETKRVYVFKFSNGSIKVLGRNDGTTLSNDVFTDGCQGGWEDDVLKQGGRLFSFSGRGT